MWEALAKILTETIPLEVRTRVVACSAFIGLLFFILYATGVFPFFEGFAKGGTVAALTHEIKDSEAEQDKDAILTLRQTECELPKGESKSIYTETITTRMQEYFRLTGTGFQLPNCSDF